MHICIHILLFIYIRYVYIYVYIYVLDRYRSIDIYIYIYIYMYDRILFAQSNDERAQSASTEYFSVEPLCHHFLKWIYICKYQYI